MAAPLVQLDEDFHEAPTAHVEAAARLPEHCAPGEVVEQQDEASVGSALEQQDVSSGGDALLQAVQAKELSAAAEHKVKDLEGAG